MTPTPIPAVTPFRLPTPAPTTAPAGQTLSGSGAAGTDTAPLEGAGSGNALNAGKLGPVFTVRVSRGGKVGATNRASFLCKLSSDSVKVCVVKLTVKVGKKTVTIGTGRRANKKANVRSLGVNVKLNARGTQVLRRAGKKKLKVRVVARVQPMATAKLAKTANVKLRRGT